MANIGKSVGAIIRDSQGHVLVLYRLKAPLGLALPAGHVEEGESPRDALCREIPEETGLKVLGTEEVYHHDSIPTLHGYCHDSHEWWVYEVEVSGEPELKEPTKHRFVRFMSSDEMKAYVEKGECDPAWFEYILPALGIL